ncbi:MAG: hypothetical protein A2W91_01145 [Bacteroidetes bacterium GWF2_38_335]|nr:MAG: hypothetical protein A2W91_01145 [Bacteroidetes bacterium GWF2_38_335]OFY80358.1 MAG: hypothetical protein A2281_17655 [Bacteroidetes bacterium RIFOXYA12_FULL_38_20]HBS88841.1 hypothetical protein [Bacteroidales bacterium]
MDKNDNKLFPPKKAGQNNNESKTKTPNGASRKSVSQKTLSLSGLIAFLNKDIPKEDGNYKKLTLKSLENKYEKVIETIIESYKAKKYIGVGVGCVLLNEDNNKVLLYKRYKNPEKDKWSMPGGGAKLKKQVEDVALDELTFITGIKFFPNQKNKNFKLKLLKVTNHYPNTNTGLDYHYVSPAFYIDIKANSDLRKQIKNKFPETEEIFRSPYEPAKQNKGLADDHYNLKWFPLDQSFTESEFTQTTVYAIQALKKHLEYADTMKDLNGKIVKLPAMFDLIFEDVMNT